MSEKEGIEAPVIEQLLATRQQLTAWLLKLDEASDGVPAQVQERVKADYEGRLAEVVFELRGHSTALMGSVETLREQLGEQERIRGEGKEAIAETELRYRVGEFTEEEWKALREESTEKLAAAEGLVAELSVEIGQFEDVLSQIHPEEVETESDLPAPAEMEVTEEKDDGQAVLMSDGEGKADANDAPPAERDDVLPEADILALKPNMIEGVKLSEPVEAPTFTPKGGDVQARDSGSHRTIRFPTPKTHAGEDDLTFLKSVVVGQKRDGEGGGAKVGERTVRSTSTSAKTLKCGDCGAMNRPTEWYCERCGAELAAL